MINFCIFLLASHKTSEAHTTVRALSVRHKRPLFALIILRAGCKLHVRLA